MDEADADADRVKRPRGGHEADAVGKAVRSGRQLSAVGVAVEDREEGDKDHRRPQRRPPLGADGEAEQEGREGNAGLDPRSGTPMSPSIPPRAMTIGNVMGSSHKAGGPSCAPHSPTETIASTWSRPDRG